MDYTKYSKQPVEEKIEEVVEEIVEIEPVVEEIVEEEPEAKTLVGIVTNCLKLNVRKTPVPNGEIICEIPALSEVLIDEKESTVNFYKIYTVSGIEGYCVKDYIAISK